MQTNFSSAAAGGAVGGRKGGGGAVYILLEAAADACAGIMSIWAERSAGAPNASCEDVLCIRRLITPCC